MEYRALLDAVEREQPITSTGWGNVAEICRDNRNAGEAVRKFFIYKLEAKFDHHPDLAARYRHVSNHIATKINEEPVIPIPPINHPPALVDHHARDGSDAHPRMRTAESVQDSSLDTCSDSGEFVVDATIQANDEVTGERTIEPATNYFMKTNEVQGDSEPVIEIPYHTDRMGAEKAVIAIPRSTDSPPVLQTPLESIQIPNDLLEFSGSYEEVEYTEFRAEDECTEEKPIEHNTNDAIENNSDRVADECTEEKPIESNTNDAIDNNNYRVADVSFHANDECTEEKPIESNTNEDNSVRVADVSVHADDEFTEDMPVESNTNDVPSSISTYLRAIIIAHERQTNRLGQLRPLVKVYCRRFPCDHYNCQIQVDSSIANHKYNTEMFKELLEIVECHQQDNKVEMAKIIRVGFLKNLRLHEECHSIFLKGLVHAMEYHRDKTNRKRLPAQVLRQFMEFRKERELITNLLYSKLEEVEVWHHRARKPIVVGKEPNEFYVIASYLIVSVLALIYDYLQTTAQLV